jgi:hypothetical protein
VTIWARFREWLWPEPIDPRKPHQFRAIDNLAAMGAGEQSGPLQGNTQAAVLAVSADAMRATCRLPGCGLPADNPIHA